MARHLPAELKTNKERCWATACSPEAPPRDSVSIEERILWRHVNARHCTRCILEESKTIRFGFSQLCINTTKRHEYVFYFFKRYFQVGSLLQSSRAAALGNSAFFKTCNNSISEENSVHTLPYDTGVRYVLQTIDYVLSIIIPIVRLWRIFVYQGVIEYIFYEFSLRSTSFFNESIHTAIQFCMAIFHLVFYS